MIMYVYRLSLLSLLLLLSQKHNRKHAESTLKITHPLDYASTGESDQNLRTHSVGAKYTS